MIKRKNNDLMMRVISEVARDLNLSEGKVNHCVDHLFLWLRDELIKGENDKLNIIGFGTFRRIEKRYQEFLAKQNKNELTNKINENESK
jgi:nucleoid DNA-binding protein